MAAEAPGGNFAVSSKLSSRADTNSPFELPHQIRARWDLPDPCGPKIAADREGQSGHRSRKRKACSLQGARMKSSRPSAGCTPNGNTSWPGISDSGTVGIPNGSHGLDPYSAIDEDGGEGNPGEDIGICRRDGGKAEGKAGKVPGDVNDLQGGRELADKERAHRDRRSRREGDEQSEDDERIATHDRRRKPYRYVAQHRERHEQREHQRLVGCRIEKPSE